MTTTFTPLGKFMQGNLDLSENCRRLRGGFLRLNNLPSSLKYYRISVRLYKIHKVQTVNLKGFEWDYKQVIDRVDNVLSLEVKYSDTAEQDTHKEKWHSGGWGKVLGELKGTPFPSKILKVLRNKKYPQISYFVQHEKVKCDEYLWVNYTTTTVPYFHLR